MTDGELAERRMALGHPSNESWLEETRQVYQDYLFHDREVQRLGRYKGFFHIVERARLFAILERRLSVT